MTRYHGDWGPTPVRNAVFRCLADARNRVVLGRTLRASAESVRVETLESALTDAFDPDRSEAPRLWLAHELLPRLEDAGLVVAADGRVSATDHPALADRKLRRLLSGDEATDGSVDACLDVLANPRRRRVCAVLQERTEPATVENLARALAAIEADDHSTRDAELVDRIRVSLVHEHVPALESAGFVQRRSDGRLAVDEPIDVDPESFGIAPSCVAPLTN